MSCEHCGGTHMRQYDHNHSKVCEHCCAHDHGWFRISEGCSGYEPGADNRCCALGCGTMARELPPDHDAIVNEATFCIIRFYRDTNERKVIKAGLTRVEAVEHGEDPDTEDADLAWFDGFEKE